MEERYPLHAFTEGGGRGVPSGIPHLHGALPPQRALRPGHLAPRGPSEGLRRRRQRQGATLRPQLRPAGPSPSHRRPWCSPRAHRAPTHVEPLPRLRPGLPCVRQREGCRPQSHLGTCPGKRRPRPQPAAAQPGPELPRYPRHGPPSPGAARPHRPGGGSNDPHQCRRRPPCGPRALPAVLALPQGRSAPGAPPQPRSRGHAHTPRGGALPCSPGPLHAGQPRPLPPCKPHRKP